MRNLRTVAGLLVGFALLAGAAGAQIPDYDRDDWPHWNAGDVRGDRLDTRQEVLVERSLVPVIIECGKSLPRVLAAPLMQYRITDGPRRCRVAAGRWLDAYGGVEIVAETAAAVAYLATIEHAITLYDAHHSGGWCWDRERRRAFANDKRYLLIVSRSKNSSRAGDDIYLPSHRPCDFVELYTGGKAEYGLGYDLAEAEFYAEQLRICRGERKPLDEIGDG